MYVRLKYCDTGEPNIFPCKNGETFLQISSIAVKEE
jgi:hypothetical protein